MICLKAVKGESKCFRPTDKESLVEWKCSTKEGTLNQYMSAIMRIIGQGIIMSEMRREIENETRSKAFEVF